MNETGITNTGKKEPFLEFPTRFTTEVHFFLNDYPEEQTNKYSGLLHSHPAITSAFKALLIKDWNNLKPVIRDLISMSNF